MILVAKVRQAFSFFRSLFRWFKKKRPTVSLPVYAQRLSTCAKCDLLDNGNCYVCGCHLKTKCNWATESCPIQRWTAEDPDPDADVTPEGPHEPE